ncbi:DUF5684 domain-containing protein [Limibacter armeniacum]|uniref:DUF5684 domain-containing protein n=1 Tax=Limibacter armeniacum TaxID=466084 RepID=UPI002FE67559
MFEDDYVPVSPESTGLGIIGYLLIAFGLYQCFRKAGEAGWMAFIPILNFAIMIKLIGHSPWLVLLFLIPLVNIIFAVYVNYEFPRRYGKGVLFCILNVFFSIIMIPILGFSDSRYLGPKTARY